MTIQQVKNSVTFAQGPKTLTRRFITQEEACDVFRLDEPKTPLAYAREHGQQLDTTSIKEILRFKTPHGEWVAKSWGATDDKSWIALNTNFGKAELVGRAEIDFFLLPDKHLFTPEAYVYHDRNLDEVVLLTRYLGDDFETIDDNPVVLRYIPAESKAKLAGYVDAVSIYFKRDSMLGDITDKSNAKLAALDLEPRQWNEFYSDWHKDRDVLAIALLERSQNEDQTREEHMEVFQRTRLEVWEQMLAKLHKSDERDRYREKIEVEAGLTRAESINCALGLIQSLGKLTKK